MLKRLLILGFCLVSSLALADEAVIRKAIQAKFPDAKIESITKTQYLGLYEVYMDKQLFYTDDKVNYIFLGHILDTKSNQDVTEQRLRKLSAISFDSLPLDAAFKKVRGNGKRKVAYFADPNCSFCKRFEQELAKVNDLTLYIFLYPILSADSTEKAKAVWCSQDQAKTWDALMLNGVVPAGSASCQTPIEKIVNFGMQHRITGTPTLIFADGSVVPGMMRADQLEKVLDKADSQR